MTLVMHREGEEVMHGAGGGGGGGGAGREADRQTVALTGWVGERGGHDRNSGWGGLLGTKLHNGRSRARGR